MVELVAVPLDNGGVIVVEMDHAEAGVVKAGRPGQIVGKAAQTQTSGTWAKIAVEVGHAVLIL